MKNHIIKQLMEISDKFNELRLSVNPELFVLLVSADSVITNDKNYCDLIETFKVEDAALFSYPDAQKIHSLKSISTMMIMNAGIYFDKQHQKFQNLLYNKVYKNN